MSVARVVRWLWSGAPAARVARLPLLPLAAAYWAAQRRRAARRARAPARLALPAIAVGNLSVGGTGKTPLAAWVAAYCAARGCTPGVLLRGYGGDETAVHRRLVPGAVVVANPDRVAGAEAARAQGARVLVLDDAYQLVGVARELNICVVSAESLEGSSWVLPAGPWREGWAALGRAQLVVITRKRAAAEAAAALAARVARRWPGMPVAIARLAPSHLEGMRSGARRALALLAGRRVVAACGVADPESFAAQLGAAGARVHLLAFRDHHPYGAPEVARLVQAAAGADYVVITEKDAVKLRPRWPEDVAEPLVAVLEVRWERGGGAVAGAVDAVLALAARLNDQTRYPGAV